MSEQPDKQEQINIDEAVKETAEGAEGKSSEPVAEPEAEPVADASSSDGVEQDIPDVLNDILDDSDEFDEIDLFDEGLLDDIDVSLDDASTVEADAETSAPDAGGEEQATENSDVLPDEDSTQDTYSQDLKEDDETSDEDSDVGESAEIADEDAGSESAGTQAEADEISDDVPEPSLDNVESQPDEAVSADQAGPGAEVVGQAESEAVAEASVEASEESPEAKEPSGPSEDEEVTSSAQDSSISDNEEQPDEFSEAKEILAGIEDVKQEELEQNELSDSFQPESDPGTESDNEDVPEQSVSDEPKSAVSEPSEDSDIPPDIPDDTEISLEVEEKASDASVKPEDSSSQEEGGEPATSEATEDTAAAEASDTDAFGDDLGISLSDDELWDDSADDDIPLFDDEPEDPVPYGPGAQAPVKESVQEGKGGEGEQKPSDEKLDDTSSAIVEDSGETSPVVADDAAGTGKEPASDDVIVVSPSFPDWVPYFISGVATMLLFGGIFVLWGMISSAPNAAEPAAVKTVDMVSQEAGKTPESPIGQNNRLVKEKIASNNAKYATPVQDIEPLTGGQSLQTFNLAPFIIPVMRQGELVFFKLTVELVVPDMKTKQELKKREAWVRDAIYTELKGIEVGPGTKGEFLLNYRRPLKKRIEKELAPLEIRDVRLMGYVLK